MNVSLVSSEKGKSVCLVWALDFFKVRTGSGVEHERVNISKTDKECQLE